MDTLRLMGKGCRAAQSIKHYWCSLISMLESGSAMISDPEDVSTDTPQRKSGKEKRCGIIALLKTHTWVGETPEEEKESEVFLTAMPAAFQFLAES